jgi:hypothetical protein
MPPNLDKSGSNTHLALNIVSEAVKCILCLFVAFTAHDENFTRKLRALE